MTDDVLQCLAPLVVLPIVRPNRVTVDALAYARSITANVVAIHVAADGDAAALETIERAWHMWTPDVPLMVVDSPCRSVLPALLSYIDALHRQQPDQILTVLIPEIASTRWSDRLRYAQAVLRLKGALLFRPGIVVTRVPALSPRRSSP